MKLADPPLPPEIWATTPGAAQSLILALQERIREEDGTSAATDYDIAIGRYLMLTQLNAIPENEPLRPHTVTISCTDHITLD